MMKKRIALLLALMMAGGMAAGCTGTSGDDAVQGESVQAESEAQEDGGEDAVQENDEDEEDEDGTSQSSFNAGDIEFEPTTVIENENCIVQLTDLEAGDGEYIISVEMENIGGSSDYTLYLDEISVEGLMYDAYCGQLGMYPYSVWLTGGVSSGTTESASIVIDTEVFEEIGITDFTDIMVTIGVEDDYDVVGEETVHIYPYGEENAQVYTREALDTDVVLADTDEAALTATGYEDEETGDFTAVLYLQNKSDQSLTFQIMNTSMNDYTIDPTFYSDNYYYELPAGCGTYIFMEFYAEDLELNDITEVDSIEFRFTLFNSDNIADLLLDEIYTLNP